MSKRDDFINKPDLGPSYMVSGTRDNPSQEASLSSVYIYENVVSVGRVKVNPAWLFITLIEKSNVQIFLFLWVSLGHPIRMCFAELILTSLIRISALNPKSRHYVTLAKARVVPGRRVKAFIWRKVVPLARVTLPAEVRQLPHPSCLASPRRVRVPNVNGWLNFGKKQAKCYLGQGNSGGRVVSGTRDHINGALESKNPSDAPNYNREPEAEKC